VDSGGELFRYEPVHMGAGVYWVGFYDRPAGLHCNPYLIVEGEEAVLIDGGSRPDFPQVMMKILKTGIHPSQISALIYQHYDPDLCGSLPHMEDMIEKEDLQILSKSENIMFIRHYGARSRIISTESVREVFRFRTGRTLRFYYTPYAHSEGNFITFDEKTGILFTSDIFGSYGVHTDFYLDFEEDCIRCERALEMEDERRCRSLNKICPVMDILDFHQKIMTSERALRYAMEVISGIPFTLIAPQHGGIIRDFKSIQMLVKRLRDLKNVGVDRFLKNIPYEKIGNIDALLARKA